MRALRGLLSAAPRAVLAVALAAWVFAPPAGAAPRIRRTTVDGARTLSARAIREGLGLTPGSPFDSTLAAAGLNALLERYRAAGRLSAAVRVETAGDTAWADVHVVVDEGPEARVDSIEVQGASAVDWAPVRSQLELRGGEPFSQEALERDIARILALYGREGRPYAVVRPGDFRQTPRGLAFRYVVDEGPRVVVARFEVEGNTQTSAERVVRQAGLEPGLPYDQDRVDHALWRLRRLGAFDQVDAGLVAGQGEGTLRYRVREGGTSTAQGALGYSADTHQVTGVFDLRLQNLGGGRSGSFRLDARGAGVTEYSLAAREPLALGTPLSVELTLGQHIEDTLYTQSQAGLSVGAEVAPYALATLSASWERVVASTGPVLNDKALKVAAGLDYDRRDEPLAPTRGVLVKLRTSLGTRTATARDSVTQAQESVREDEIGFEAYVPLAGRSPVLALLGFAKRLVTDQHPAPDYELYPLGGATSLRGYREQQFRGPVVGVGTVELRWLTAGHGGYVFLFAEAGYVRIERAFGDGYTATNLVRPGVGLGVRMPTRLGFMGLDYAWGESFSPLGGKIHVSIRSQF